MADGVVTLAVTPALEGALQALAYSMWRRCPSASIRLALEGALQALAKAVTFVLDGALQGGALQALTEDATTLALGKHQRHSRSKALCKPRLTPWRRRTSASIRCERDDSRARGRAASLG